MGMLIIVLALIVVVLVASGKPEELVPVKWGEVVIRRGYTVMPKPDRLHGHSMIMSEHQAQFKQWYRRKTDYGPVFFAIHEDGSRWEIRAFVENQQDWDPQSKKWYLQTYYILEKAGYYYL